MYVEQVLIEQAPHLFNWIGPGCIRRQRQERDATVLLPQGIEHIAMEMYRPIIQGDEDAFGLRVLLLNEQEKRGHLAHVEARAFAAEQRSALHIQAARDASLGPVPWGLHGSWGRSSPFAVRLGGGGLAPIGVLILVEEDEALWQPHAEHAGLGNRLHLLCIERV